MGKKYIVITPYGDAETIIAESDTDVEKYIVKLYGELWFLCSYFEGE